MTRGKARIAQGLLGALLLGCGSTPSTPEPPIEAPVEVPAEVPNAPVAAPPEVAVEAPVEAAVEPVAEPAPTVESFAPFVAIDTHSDTTQRLLDEHADLASRLPNGHVDLIRMREGGLSAVFMSIWVDPRRYPGEEAWTRAQALIASVRDFVAAHPDQVVLATTADEVRQANREGHAAMLMGIEGAHAFGEAEPEVLLQRLEESARLGVRYVTLTWTNDNVFGHASTGHHPGRGLTDLGRTLVTRMNDLGVMVDVSHVSDRTVLDAIEVTRSPVIASHSSARALADHPRNLSDVLLRRIAENHGAVCINYYAHFIDPAYGEARRALEREHRAEFDALPRGRSWTTATARNALAHQLAPDLHPPTIRTLGAHFAHVAEVAGMDAVCMGSDFDGISEPTGIVDVSEMGNIYAELTRRSLDVQRIAGENVLRVMAANEANARH